MWKAPNRPNNQISQTYNDGMLTVYSVADSASAGYKPLPVKTEKVKLLFEERTLGLRRYYEARQNQVEIERVVRVQKAVEITSQDVVTIGAVEYRIDLVQTVADVYPASLDLSLVRIKEA